MRRVVPGFMAAALVAFVAEPAEAEPRTGASASERLERPGDPPRRALSPRERTRADGQGATPLAFAPPPLPITTPALRMQGLAVSPLPIQTGTIQMEGLGYGGIE